VRTSELATRAGVNPQTLRYYERRGLLRSPPRSAAGYRSYPAEAVRVVRFVKRAQELGFSLDEVAELLQLAGGGPRSCEAARAVAEARVADLEARIGDLGRMRDSLRTLVGTCARPRPEQRDCPLLEAISSESRASADARSERGRAG